ncbi:MAG: hypothetical protein ACYTGW_16165 [Planctomycetota bacterium]
MTQGLDVRSYQPGDDEAFYSLHKRVFRPRWSERRWRWRFHQNPTGATQLVGAFSADGQCVALHGGVMHRFLLEGSEVLGVSHGDVVVDPDRRHGLGGARLAVRVGQCFIDTYCKRTGTVVWGFPEPELRRLLVRFLHVEVLADVVFLIHELGPSTPAPDSIRVHEVQRWGPDIDTLWATCRPEFAATVVRDSSYLNWRYADHPDIDYHLLEARDRHSSELRGICAVREGGWDEAVLSVSEWLVPASDCAAEHALVGRCIDAARQRGKRCVVCWFPTQCVQFHSFQVDHGFIAHPTPYQQVFMSWAPGVDRGWLHEHWYQTMGDIDFF